MSALDLAAKPWLSTPAHLRWLEAESDRLLTFAQASRHPAGGFARLDDTGRPIFDRPTELWITCRMTHAFAVGHLLGRPGCLPLVRHGVEALRSHFHDAKNGGWYSSIGGSGPAAGSKDAYPHTFVVLAASSAACAGAEGAEALLDTALSVLIEKFWDDETGMLSESWDETFTSCDEYRGLNANMHAVEALIAASDVTADRSLLIRARRIAERVHALAAGHDGRLPEHFDSRWEPQLDYNADAPADPFRPFGATIGHGLEWSRLFLHLHAALGPDAAPGWLLEDARELFAAAARDGWAVDGADGFVYTVDWAGRPVVRERMHWVVAEGISAAAALHAATGDPAYDAWYRTWWDHAATVFVDPVLGSWHHELDAHNRPSGVVWNGKPDVYHALGATLAPRLPLAPATAPALRAGLLD